MFESNHDCFFFGSVYWPTFFGLVSHPYPLKSGDYSPSKCYDNGRILIFRNEVRVAEKCPSNKHLYTSIYKENSHHYSCCPWYSIKFSTFASHLQFCNLLWPFWGHMMMSSSPELEGSEWWSTAFLGCFLHRVFFSGLVTRVWTLGEFLPVQRKQMKFFGDKWWIEWCLFSCQLLGVNIRAGSMVQNHAMSSTCPFLYAVGIFWTLVGGPCNICKPSFDL